MAHALVTRRRFLRGTAAASALAAFPAAARAAAPSPTSGLQNGPVVLATWNNGPAVDAAWTLLGLGGQALDAVEAGVQIPEADPNDRSVGLGGRPDRDGRVTLDACIMDEAGRCGSVAALEHILHPISVARRVMERTPHVMLVGEGALRFALEQGFERTNLLTAESEREWRAWLTTSQYRPVANIERHDTIGMIAVGVDEHLAGACTTSGMAYKMHGRVGDSPIIGAGLFVDDEVGAATATGVGEEVIRICGAHLIVELMRQGRTPDEACREAVQRLVRKTPSRLDDVQVGFLALRKDGATGAYAVRPGFSYVTSRIGAEGVLADAPAHFA